MNSNWLLLHSILLLGWCWSLCAFRRLLFLLNLFVLFFYFWFHSCRMRSCCWWRLNGCFICTFQIRFWFDGWFDCFRCFLCFLFFLFSLGLFWRLLFFLMNCRLLLKLLWWLRLNLTCSTIHFGYNSFFSKSKVRNNFISLFDSIISLSLWSTVQIKVSFEPLNKLKIVLILCFD